MTCDWIVFRQFTVLYEENGQLKEIKLEYPYTDNLPVWFSYCSDDIQDDIDEWKRSTPYTCLYAYGKWVQTNDNIVYSIPDWCGFKEDTKKYYTTACIEELLGEYKIDFKIVIMITATHYGKKN